MATCAMQFSVRHAMASVRYLFHVAADYRLWARDPREIVENNVAGTAHRHARGARAGVERIVYTSSVATLKCGRRACRDDDAAPRSRPSAPTSAARSRPNGWSRPWRGGLPRGHRQSIDADRAERRQADADRAHDPAGGGAPHAGLRRYRAQHGACRRCRRGPSRGVRARAHRRAIYPRWAERHARGNSRHRRRRMRASPTAHQNSARGRDADCGHRGSARASHRARTAGDARRLAHVEEPHVLQRRQGRARAWV